MCSCFFGGSPFRAEILFSLSLIFEFWLSAYPQIFGVEKKQVGASTNDFSFSGFLLASILSKKIKNKNLSIPMK